jgi:VWFA-related protein
MASFCERTFGILIISLFLFVPNAVWGQEPVRQKELQELAEKFASEWEQERAEVEAYAERKGIPIRRETPDGRTVILKRIENGKPLYEIDLNREGAETSSVDEVHPGGSLGLSLTGAGETLGIWEAGNLPLASHQEFEDSGGQSRVSLRGSAPTDDHATHVAGTMIAAGVDDQAQGMAFEAELNAWDSGADDSEMATAAANGLGVSNHSYGFLTGWHCPESPSECDSGNETWQWHGDPDIDSEESFGFGFYGPDARDWDTTAYKAPNYVIVKSAGNDRDDEPANQPVPHEINGNSLVTGETRDPDGGLDGYNSIPRKGTAKNIITVGAVEGIPGGYSSPSDVQISGFSGWGPTDDGRIKPDLVAKGGSVYSSTFDSDNSNSNSEYERKWGTSMSAPMVSGSVGLLHEHYGNLNNGDVPLSSTIKALLIHTADDATGNEGPDYRHGWGLMNVERAADLITTGAGAGDLIQEAELSENETFEYQVYSDGSSPLRTTVAWTDPAGSPPFDLENPPPDADADPSEQMLVNDLDIRIEGPNGSEYQPYILDPSNPGDPAQTGDNTRDNVEQVLVDNPSQGDYTISVSHKGGLTDGPQSFSLVMSGVTTLSDLQITFNEVRTSFFPMITSVVTATDSDGDVVTGLEGENFEMEEEGALETIVNVDETRESGGNVSSSLVLDRSGSMSGGALSDAKDAAETFVDQLEVGDQASVISFSDGVRVDQPFTADVEALKSAIDNLSSGGGTALYDGMIQGIEEIELEANSPAVLALTDGKENESSNSKQDAIELADQVGVPVYTIGLGSDVNAGDLQDVADQTGGQFFQAPNPSDLETIYQEISQQLSSRYEVTHLTSNILLDGTERTIELTASTGGGVSGTESTTYTAPEFQIPFIANFDSDPDPGETAQASVDIGSESQPADDLFRATFTVEYDAENLDVISDEPGSFLGSDVEYRSSINDSTGTIDIGIRKQAGNDASLKNILAKRSAVEKNSQDQGTLAQIEFSADEDAPSGKNYDPSVNNVSAADADGNPIAAEVAPTLLSPAPQTMLFQSSATLDWDISGIDQQYRVQVATDSTFQSLDIDRTTSDTEISLQDLDGKKYFWRVRAENAENGPWSDVSSFSIRPAELQVSVQRSFGEAEEKQDYRLVALPGQASGSLSESVSGDWRGFQEDGRNEDQPYSRSECEGSCQFEPGEGFWLITDQSWEVNQTVSTVPLSEAKTAQIDLQEGWNIVSNPFGEEVAWNRVQVATGTSQPLWQWDGSWSRVQTFAAATAGEAYYFRSDSLSQLTVPYPVPEAVPQTKADTAESGRQALTLSAVRGDRRLSTIEAGVRPDAKEGLDPFDQYGPPGYFGEATLRLIQKEKGRRRVLATEYTPPDEEGTAFDLILQAKPDTVLTLQASGLGDRGRREAVLVNQSTSEVHDLMGNGEVTVVPQSEETSYRLLVGSSSFVKENQQAITPESVKLLANYPNPFRTGTTIEYALPKDADVRLAVYDVLGRQVAVLEEGRRESGFHRVRWDVGDQALSSGVYFYRLRAGEKTKSGRMVLLR